MSKRQVTTCKQDTEEKKRWLQSYRLLEQETARLLEEMERWRSRAQKATQICTSMPGGGSRDTLPECVTKIMELEQQLDAQIDKMVDQRREIEGAITSMEGGELGHLLRLRYIDGRTWETIAADMNYTYRWVLYLHSRALEALKLPQPQEAPPTQ